MKRRNISIVIGGEAGSGVMISGLILSKAFAYGGLSVFTTNDYPSLIRGGHNWIQIQVGTEKVWAQHYKEDLLIALSPDTVNIHSNRLHEKSGIIFNEEYNLKVNSKKFPIPTNKILKRHHALPVMANTIMLGATIALLGYDINLLIDSIESAFKGKEKTKLLNIELAKEGFNYALRFSSKYEYKVKKGSKKNFIVLSGNEAVALGAIKAGMKFYAAYPMTPASPILHFLAGLQRDFRIAVIQTESEIAAINMITGAAYAGVRAMTATSGGGFSLMTEALGQAAQTETPVVIVIAQRPGPSTGLATYTSQGDLRFVIHASQGEFPRVVIAPGDVEEAFYLTIDAFNLAEKYQIPVIILTDKYLAESYMSVDKFNRNIEIDRGKLISGEYNEDDTYKRYKITNDGISPRAIPGTLNAIVKVTSNEHTEDGFASSNEKNAEKMNDKRFKKLKFLIKDIEKRKPVRTYGYFKEPEITLIGWGSVKLPVLEALNILYKEYKVKAKFVHLVYLYPFPTSLLKNELKSPSKKLLIENNKTAQLGSLIDEYLHLDIENKLLKYNGRPFFPEEIIDEVMK